MAKEKSKNYKICVYMRVGNKVYTSLSELNRDIQRERAIKRMTPEQIALCERIRQEIEGNKYAPMR